jgi:acyl dehydratase
VIGPFDSTVDEHAAREYGALAIVTRIFAAENAGRAALVPDELKASATGGVHGEHDVVLYRPIAPGEPLRTWVSPWGTRPAGRNALVTLRFETRDGRDAVVAEQWWTTVWLGTTCETTGKPAPDHALPDEARQRPLGEHVVDIDTDMARRYAEASGDWSAHHFDVEAAKRTGFDRVFLHGLCTMTLCAQGIVTVATGGDADRVRRVAVRFASPTFLGEQLHVRVYDAGPLGYAFEAESAGAPVITHGRAELR